MRYETGMIYHVYNRGINRQVIFFKPENYLFFLDKIRKHILPCSDILSYCLMPNHFHLQLIPNTEGCSLSNAKTAHSAGSESMQKLSLAFQSLLSGYSRAINRQEKRTGSLFQHGTKVKIGWGADDHQGKLLYDTSKPYTIQRPYVVKCFKYIHNNPVKARLVKVAHEWEYSSALDYIGERDNGICNFELAEQYLGIKRLNGIGEYERLKALRE